MPDPQDLEAKIQQKLQSAQEKLQTQKQGLTQKMGLRDEREKQFGEVVSHLAESIIEPRLGAIGRSFSNATLTHADTSIGRHWAWSFARTPQYPATVKLAIGVSHDEEVEKLLFQYSLEILPIYFQFPQHAELSMPLGGIDETAIADWIEERVLEFVDVYLQIGEIDQYRKEITVTDPVCGMEITHNLAAAQEAYRRRTYYFCTPACHQKFVEDPSRYVASGP